MLGVERPEGPSMGGFHKFRFEEMRSISLPICRVRLRARCTALSGALFSNEQRLAQLPRAGATAARAAIKETASTKHSIVLSRFLRCWDGSCSYVQKPELWYHDSVPESVQQAQKRIPTGGNSAIWNRLMLYTAFGRI
jgi:hypothetical protein